MYDIEFLRSELNHADDLLFKIDRVLDSAQPNIEGKIRIKFWRVNGRLEPNLVVRTKKRTSFPKKINISNLVKRAKSSGEFSKNYQITYQLLSLTCEVWKYRLRLKSLITNIESRVRSTVNGNFQRLGNAEKILIGLDKDIFEYLKENGKEGYYKSIQEPFLEVRVSEE